MTTPLQFTGRRNMRGDLQAESAFPLGFDRRELRVSTYKTSVGMVCYASVVQVDEDGRSHTHEMFGDYSKRLAANPSMRCTEKNIRAMHGAALAGIDAVLTEARAKYKPAAYKFGAHLIGCDSQRVESITYECAGPGLTTADIEGAEAKLRELATARGLGVSGFRFENYEAHAWLTVSAEDAQAMAEEAADKQTRRAA